jgi:hypothetical protein
MMKLQGGFLWETLVENESQVVMVGGGKKINEREKVKVAFIVISSTNVSNNL